jgi:hypothetical protein
MLGKTWLTTRERRERKQPRRLRIGPKLASIDRIEAISDGPAQMAAQSIL